jgi:hypothetical protein
MAIQTTSMTTREFAKAAGVPAASISKLIRDGKLKAKKAAGKWMIPQSQLGSEVVRALKRPSKLGEAKSARARQVSEPEAAPVRQLSVPAASTSPKPEPIHVARASEPTPAAPPEPEARLGDKKYTIPEFAAMTYLTESGVAEWLKSGRIKGVQIEDGEWRVLESNLQIPDISRLLRK